MTFHTELRQGHIRFASHASRLSVPIVQGQLDGIAQERQAEVDHSQNDCQPLAESERDTNPELNIEDPQFKQSLLRVYFNQASELVSKSFSSKIRIKPGSIS